MSVGHRNAINPHGCSPGSLQVPLLVSSFFAPFGQPAEIDSAVSQRFNEALRQPPAPRVETLQIPAVPPRTFRVAVTAPVFRARSFFFSQEERLSAGEQFEPVAAEPWGEQGSPWASMPLVSTKANAHTARSGSVAASRPPVRIRPPEDVVKLADRLEYLLQPPLEMLLAERRLGFPCAPFPFQFEGVAFLYPRVAAILADEMGLGKTMQAITAIRLLLHRGEVRSVLLVCPKSLVSNWRREFALWAPEVPVMVIEGEQARRTWQWHLPNVPIRIANYELLCRDRDLFAPPEATEPTAATDRHLAFDLVVLDEAQRIKNHQSTTSEVVRSIARRRSWALTGTPVENSTEDLVGIFEFLAPGFLSPEMKPRRLGRTIRDYVLRRTKDQVLDELPPKMIHDTTLELTAEQRESYRLAERHGVLRLTELGREATIRHVFELVLRLKQICNFDPATGASAKLERLLADLEEIVPSGRKALVFSQWVGTLRRLARALRHYGAMEYHGQLPPAARDEVLRRFREDPQRGVLLLSYAVGGVGLNLQFVDYVFLFDRWWNPAVEDQAINRAHRLGTTRPVTVVRFLALDTIEERIERVLDQKRELFQTIFDGELAPQRPGLTQEELFGLFQLHCPAAAGRAA
jgi:SNF2 family DNA or RNA helicase